MSREAHEFIVIELKVKLQETSLPTAETKTELITRLQSAEPLRTWIQESAEDTEKSLTRIAAMIC